MNWEQAGALGEIVGAVAVVLSLVYLARQIHIQNQESRANAVHQVIEGYRSSVAELLDPGMAEIWVLGMEDFDQLTTPQQLRFFIYLTVTLRSFENAYFQWRQGRLETDVWNPLLAPLIDVKSTAAFGVFWKMRKHHFRLEFADYVEKLESGDYSYLFINSE